MIGDELVPLLEETAPGVWELNADTLTNAFWESLREAAADRERGFPRVCEVAAFLAALMPADS